MDFMFEWQKQYLTSERNSVYYMDLFRVTLKYTRRRQVNKLRKTTIKANIFLNYSVNVKVEWILLISRCLLNVFVLFPTLISFYVRTKGHLYFHNNNNENGGKFSEFVMSLLSVTYGKYAHRIPDVVKYEFYECLVFSNRGRLKREFLGKQSTNYHCIN